MNTFSIVVVLVMTTFAVDGQNLYQWKKQINKEIVAKEFARVNEKEKRIMMYANDSVLDETKYTRSVSLHDFETNYVALKSFGKAGSKQTCYIGKVVKSLDETIKIVEGRNKDKITVPMAREALKIIDSDSTLTTEEVGQYSKKFPEFCDNTDIYLLRSPTQEENMKLDKEGKEEKKEILICIILVVGIIFLTIPPAY